MKRVLFLLLALIFLTISAFADTGPKPLISVQVNNAPEELYYLDLVEEEEYPAGRDFHGLSEKAYGTLDSTLLAAMRSAIPDGYHGCLSQGQPSGPPVWGTLTPVSTGKDGSLIHNFRYSGVPNVYRILLVTESGDVFLSDILERHTLQTSVHLDYAAHSVSTPSPTAAYVLQFLATLLPTLLIEGALLLIFRLGKKQKNLLAFLLVNLLTQGALALYFSYNAVRYGVNFSYYLLLFPAEAVIMAAEALIYSFTLDSPSRRRTFAYAITANLISALAGLVLAMPVWQFTVSFL